MIIVDHGVAICPYQPETLLKAQEIGSKAGPMALAGKAAAKTRPESTLGAEQGELRILPRG
ncbi:MAG: hypothetical protein CM15mP68_5710 [Pseudomonadota bacterium]|nr:MAG: hypothetical protein CM15mP68_5710 [Pseudomonadota bacterium]